MKEVALDNRGFNQMIVKLQRFTTANAKTIVKGITSEVVHLAAAKTKSQKSIEKLKESTSRVFRRPWKSEDGTKITLTKAGLLWAKAGSNTATGKRGHILIRSGVTRPQASIPAVLAQRDSRTGKNKKLGRGRQAQEIRAAMRVAARTYGEMLKYRKSSRGLGQASFLQLLRMLKIPVRQQRGIRKFSYSVKIPRKVKNALKASTTGDKKNTYTVIVSSRVRAALNPHSRGIGAMRAAMNGKQKQFSKVTEKKFKDFASKFVRQHGGYIK